MNYYTKEKIKDWLATLAMIILGVFIGVGAAIIVTRAIDNTKQTACFDYHTEEACEATKDGE